ncbi:slr1306 family protein [Merismopedia glauca]|uniref:DUF697 domain-containing protein n=1 Tax=Merismopedia glauca CCAP 1448/3 TaxID=1296344 RepID=A0A2T1C9Y2_9CYAN|nr:DUF697 domain-containing protein [Merismopedia glauca]PSB05049.1 hypothetical protein C7B64_01430 [Merismopedia glauca CCAP 1448/3]
MAVSVQRPLLIGGIAISFGLWILQSLHHSFQEFGEVAILGVMGIGAGLWWFRSRKAAKIALSPLSQPLAAETVTQAISQAELLLNQLATESKDPLAQNNLQSQLEQVKANLDRTKLNVTVTGGKGVGKTSICQALASVNPVETLPLFTATPVDVLSPIRQGDAELVLLVTNGDLTSSEAQILQELKNLYQRTLLVFNKQDRYGAEDRSLVLQQLQRHAQGILNSEDIIATATAPSKIKVRQEQADGSFQESWEQPSADVDGLTQRLEQILASETEQLVRASTWRKAIGLQSQIKDTLNGVRRDRALPIIEQYQWITAATAFANPVPALDLLATAAINAQLVIDLGQIYQQKLSLENAQTVASSMGSLMVKQGLVELSSQAIATVLKSHVITFVAGGVVQGLSAAYLTRVAALTLIEYFESQALVTTTQSSPFNLQQVSQILVKVFQDNQRTAYIQSFVTYAISQLNLKSLLPQTP